MGSTTQSVVVRASILAAIIRLDNGFGFGASGFFGVSVFMCEVSSLENTDVDRIARVSALLKCFRTKGTHGRVHLNQKAWDVERIAGCTFNFR